MTCHDIVGQANSGSFSVGILLVIVDAHAIAASVFKVGNENEAVKSVVAQLDASL